ncbi:MAG: hypothetical protein ISS49_05205 [Anaerolineae bacterium]|nr:hypothetical protein [Anaerolineae bacterium]
MAHNADDSGFDQPSLDELISGWVQWAVRRLPAAPGQPGGHLGGGRE